MGHKVRTKSSELGIPSPRNINPEAYDQQGFHLEIYYFSMYWPWGFLAESDVSQIRWWEIPSRESEIGWFRFEICWGLRFELCAVSFEVWALSFELWGLRFEVEGLKFEVWGLRFQLWGLRSEVWDLRSEGCCQSLGFRALAFTVLWRKITV